MPVNGSCLCGSVRFVITGALPDLYQCHCSLCRKLTGAAADAAMFLNAEQFQWLQGEPLIRSYQTASGYRSDFCTQCGSTVPHRMRNGMQFWVPAGLLEGVPDTQVTAHLFVDSKAHWDAIGGAALQYAEMPEMPELNRLLSRRRTETD